MVIKASCQELKVGLQSYLIGITITSGCLHQAFLLFLWFPASSRVLSSWSEMVSLLLVWLNIFRGVVGWGCLGGVFCFSKVSDREESGVMRVGKGCRLGSRKWRLWRWRSSLCFPPSKELLEISKRKHLFGMMIIYQISKWFKNPLNIELLTVFWHDEDWSSLHSTNLK